ncbi:cupin domain-containing protein [Rosenbergiella sp. S61]|uniref:Cupin domain-containing protein n=1 Tax=Rosenbergiella gaditana TaxID=2726987 RepID=A0ABS5T1G6_9GAMM|nr:cupin domain-containing protein [Rosenbergiella gaditana]MBT0725312.1 cupin domain-containing protein [Rosenbergiella gaditana]
MSTNFTGESLFPKGEKNDAFAQYFMGTSYLSMLSTEGVNIGNVVFEPGCRNNCHVHHAGGQILLVTDGYGWYQAWNEPPQALKPGDVVNIPAGVKHWHGATKDSWFAHVAIAIPAEGASNEWLEPVTDEHYAALA